MPKIKKKFNIQEKIIDDSDITFEEKEHRYFHKNGQELLSITKFIHGFSEKFDEDGSIIKRCAARDGLTIEQLRAQWDKKRDDACVYGTKVHKSIENFLSEGVLPEKTDLSYKYVKQFSQNYNFKGVLYSENKIFSLKYGLCGTADLLNVLNASDVSVYDFKTNEKFNKYSPWKKKLLGPVRHLDDCHFNNYSLQISLYLFLLDEEWGFWPSEYNGIFYINRKDEKIDYFAIPYLKKEIFDMICFYQKYGLPQNAKKEEEQEDL